ncbi:MAG: hypothetical protein R3Y21_02485 [Mycoplasmatota bacterium]
MELKSKLSRIKEGIIKDIKIQKEMGYSTSYSIDEKVDDFINWYDQTHVFEKYTETGEYLEPRNMQNLIEKMAVWYELKYPKEQVQQRFSNESNFLIPEGNFSYEDYLNTLDIKDKWFLYLGYSDIVYVNKGQHLHLDRDGIVVGSEVIEKIDFDAESKTRICYFEFEGFHIFEVIEYLNLMGYPCEIPHEIKEYLEQKELKERFLDAVMLRIIDRGQNRIGPKRAFMFAQEFNRNIETPMSYGVDYSDPNLRYFICEYIKAGGDPNLTCLAGYGFRTSEKTPLKEVSIKELLNKTRANALVEYTEEETELHQNFANQLTKQKEECEKRLKYTKVVEKKY